MTDIVLDREDGASIVTERNRLDVLTAVERIDVLTGSSRTDLLLDVEPSALVLDATRTDVLAAPQRIDILTTGAGPRGAQGTPGASSSASLTGPAAQTLSGHRAVRMTALGELDYASNGIPGDAFVQLGITEGATMQGLDAAATTFGQIVEPTWNWAPDVPVFLGVNGALTQTTPTTGFIRIVGYPLSATELFVNAQLPIVLM